MKDTIEPDAQTVPETPPLFSANSLRAHLSRLRDPRNARGIRYSLAALLTLLILAKLGGEDSLKGMADWLRLRENTLLRLLGMNRDRLPHQTTYERLLAKLDSDELEADGAFSLSPWRENP